MIASTDNSVRSVISSFLDGKFMFACMRIQTNEIKSMQFFVLSCIDSLECPIIENSPHLEIFHMKYVYKYIFQTRAEAVKKAVVA